MSRLKTLRRWWRKRSPYLAWKLTHPTGRFSEFYLASVERRLDGGEVHPTLGGASTATERFHETGRKVFERLRAEGLCPDQRVVDYGCGSLRVGRHLIEFLEPGGYVGLDLTERFFRAGLAELDPQLVTTKRPELAVIGEEELARRAVDPPDFLISIGVVIHVPPGELDVYLGRLARLVGSTTRACISFYDDRRQRRVASLTWSWPAAELVSACARHGVAAESFPLEELPIDPALGCTNSMLRIRRR